MKIENSWTDLIFQNRNKEYGGYSLRKDYDNVVVFSLLLSVFFFVITSGGIFLYYAFKEVNYDTSSVVYDMSEIPIMNQANLPDYLKSPPPDKLKDKEKVKEPVVIKDTIQPDTVEKSETPTDSVIQKGLSQKSGQGNDSTGIGQGLMVIERFPSFPGGEVARKKFIRDNIRLTKEFTDAKIKGTVFISFIVEPNGTLSEIKVDKGLGYGCDEEAVRVVKMMPTWIPATRKGEPVRMVLKMPITFSL